MKMISDTSQNPPTAKSLPRAILRGYPSVDVHVQVSALTQLSALQLLPLGAVSCPQVAAGLAALQQLSGQPNTHRTGEVERGYASGFNR